MALVGTWHPARVNAPQRTRIFFITLSLSTETQVFQVRCLDSVCLVNRFLFQTVSASIMSCCKKFHHLPIFFENHFFIPFKILTMAVLIDLLYRVLKVLLDTVQEFLHCFTQLTVSGERP